MIPLLRVNTNTPDTHCVTWPAVCSAPILWTGECGNMAQLGQRGMKKNKTRQTEIRATL